MDDTKTAFFDEEKAVFLLAGATGFEPAVSALTGPHVKPLHHAPEQEEVYHTLKGPSRQSACLENQRSVD